MDREYAKIRFFFDVDKQGKIDRLTQYGIKETDSGSKDKEAFLKAYDLPGAKLDVFKSTEENKFVIPYEMADLYCLMMGVMKKSPTFYTTKNLHLQEMQSIIEYNKKIVEAVEGDNLPPQISEYIKQMPEYINAVCLINYAPIVIERMSALLHLAFDAEATSIKKIYESLIENLDEIYEDFFWRKTRLKHISELEKKNEIPFKMIGQLPDPDSKVYPSLGARLAALFCSLDRSNWPTGNEAKFVKGYKGYIRTLEEKYKDEENSESKIKNDFLIWLCDQKWHVLNELIINPFCFFKKEDVEENAKIYCDMYNKVPTAESLLTCGYGADPMVKKELVNIRKSLQNVIDIYLVQSFLLVTPNFENISKEFQKPEYHHLSQYIYDFVLGTLHNVSESLYDNQLEAKGTLVLLTEHLARTLDSLNYFDNKYTRYGLNDYAMEIVNGKMDIFECSEKIYVDVFVKVQHEKIEKYSKRKYLRLKNSLSKPIGEALTTIIKYDGKKKRRN